MTNHRKACRYYLCAGCYQLRDLEKLNAPSCGRLRSTCPSLPMMSLGPKATCSRGLGVGASNGRPLASRRRCGLNLRVGPQKQSASGWLRPDLLGSLDGELVHSSCWCHRPTASIERCPWSEILVQNAGSCQDGRPFIHILLEVSESAVVMQELLEKHRDLRDEFLSQRDSDGRPSWHELGECCAMVPDCSCSMLLQRTL